MATPWVPLPIVPAELGSRRAVSHSPWELAGGRGMLRQPPRVLPPGAAPPATVPAPPHRARGQSPPLLLVPAAASTGSELTPWHGGCRRGQPCHGSLSSLPKVPYQHPAAADHPASSDILVCRGASPACGEGPGVPVLCQQLWGEPAASSTAQQGPCPKTPSPWRDEGAASSSFSHFLSRTVTPGQFAGQRGRGQAGSNRSVPHLIGAP